MSSNNNPKTWRETLAPADKFKLLIEESKEARATSSSIDINVKPAWFDQERYERAQILVSDLFYPSISISSLTGLLITLQSPDILEALLKTGKSQTVTKLLYRYTDTIKYVRTWYESKNIFDPSDEGGRSIRLVRGMHERIFKLMNSNTIEGDDNNSNSKLDDTKKLLRVNQYDMAMTQFSFIGALLLFPRKCGAQTATDQELVDMAYYWRLLAYLLGIEDKYNLCTYDDIDNLRELFTLVCNHVQSVIGRPSERHPIGVAMAEGVCIALEELLSDLDFNILDHWWRPELLISGNDIPKPLSITQRYKSLVFNFNFKYLLSVRALLSTVSNKYKDRFDKFDANKDKHAERLTKRYGYLTYEKQLVDKNN